MVLFGSTYQIEPWKSVCIIKTWICKTPCPQVYQEETMVCVWLALPFFLSSWSWGTVSVLRQAVFRTHTWAPGEGACVLALATGQNTEQPISQLSPPVHHKCTFQMLPLEKCLWNYLQEQLPGLTRKFYFLLGQKKVHCYIRKDWSNNTCLSYF